MSTLRRLGLPLLVLALSTGLVAVAPGPAGAAEVPPATVPAPPSATTAPPSSPEDGSSLQQEQDEVGAAEIQAVAQLKAIQTERAALQLETQRLNERIASAGVDVMVAVDKAHRADIKSRFADVAVRRARIRIALADRLLHDQTVSAYIRGGLENQELSTLIASIEKGPDAGNAVGASASYADVVVDHQRLLLRELGHARTDLASASKVAGDARTASAAAERAVKKRLAQLEADKVRVVQVSADLDQKLWYETIAYQDLQVRKIQIAARLSAEQKSSDGIQQILASWQANQPDYAPGAISFQAPIPGHTFGSGFGMRHHPILNIDRLHAGDDIHASAGEPIYAAAAGVVVLAEERGGYGNCTVIDHGFGIATLYGHQSQLLVKSGDIVAKGALIGLVGSTGLSTGPHLHFETRVRGVPIDPVSIIPEIIVGGPPPDPPPPN